MKTTYYIEDFSGQILIYYSNLSDAKDFLQTKKPYMKYRIVCLKGFYKYEGEHAYYLYFNGEKYLKNIEVYNDFTKI